MSKRLFDLIISSLAVLCLLTVVTCIALVVRCKLSTPLIFRQIRPSIQGKPSCRALL